MRISFYLSFILVLSQGMLFGMELDVVDQRRPENIYSLGDSILQMHQPIREEIFSYLTGQEVLMLGQVSHGWRNAAAIYSAGQQAKHVFTPRGTASWQGIMFVVRGHDEEAEPP